MWLWVTVGFMTLLSVAVAEGIPNCQVMVHEPWPMPYIFVTRNSSVAINCTGSASNPNVLFWAINLSEDSLDIALHFGRQTTATLNDHGVYELPLVETPGMPSTLRLLINDTAKNNGTEIFCSIYEQSSTTLFLIEPSFSFEVFEISEGAINISWSQYSKSVAVSDAVQTFSLTVSHGSSSQVISLNDSFYYFTAPEDAPPCEVYNFSVTAKYNFVGASYTGAGCNISGYASVMLPSLPNITRLRTSLEHELMKVSSTFTLTVLFEPASYCEQYPVLNYTLEVKGPSSDVLSQSVSPGEENIIHNLTENTIYTFRVLVSNSVSEVSTNWRQFFTTDVQNVTATPVETMDAFVVQCDFITGSNAQGCMVVLMGEVDNVTCTAMLTLERYGCEVLNVSHPLSCYHEIFAFDIESDGSVGTLAVPGVFNSTTSCVSTTSTPNDTSRTTECILVVIGIGCGVSTATICLIILIICICCKFKRSKKRLMVVQPSNIYNNEPDTNCSELAHCTDEELEIQAAEILYDQPVKARERCSGDGAEHEKTKHTKDLKDTTAVEREMNTYAELTEENHHYHTLEPQRVPHGLEVDPDAPALPPPYRPPSPEPLPAYQEIGSLQVVKYDQERDTTNDEIVNDQYESSQNQPPSEGAEVSSETLL